MPKPKFNSFGKLAEFLKAQEAEKAGRKLVDASKNAAKGTRQRIKTGVIKTTPGKTQKIATVDVKPVELPEFKPYYIKDENPNILTPEQQQLKAELVKSAQIGLTKYQRELANRGINTSGSHRKAGALAVATNPNTVITSPEGSYKIPYSSGSAEWEGAPLKEWFDLASQDMLPHGPNASWRKLETPLKQATESFNVAGQQRAAGAPAYSLTTSKLGEGLDGLAQYMGIKPLEAKQIIIRKPYSSPQINIASNYIGPDMGPGIYGYHTATNEWWPLSKRSADTAAGNIEKYSMFGAIGEKQHLPQQISNRHNVIEKGSTFEGYPFVIRANRNPENFKFRTGDDASGPADWANSGSGSWKVRGHKQGGILFAKSGIHIKKENRGKFTSYCGGKVTSECIARGKHSSNPAIRKRATFAANARKWKHQEGGKFIPYWTHNILGGE